VTNSLYGGVVGVTERDNFSELMCSRGRKESLYGVNMHGVYVKKFHNSNVSRSKLSCIAKQHVWKAWSCRKVAMAGAISRLISTSTDFFLSNVGEW
jgi:hypothetical protein